MQLQQDLKAKNEMNFAAGPILSLGIMPMMPFPTEVYNVDHELNNHSR
jgi:hypothetical protein